MAVVGRAEVKIVADARGFSRQAERAVNRELQRVKVDADPIRNGIAQGLVGAGVQRAVTRNASRSAAGWLNQFGRILQGGISTRAAGFIGAAALAAFVPVMTVVGTLAGGALVTAFGAAIAAIPLIVAAQNETIQKSFAGSFRRINMTLQRISQPFISTWISILGTMVDTFDAFVGPLERAFADLGGPAGPIAQFVNHLGEAFEELIPTIGPITDAFSQILEDLGPELRDDVFPGLADAIINVSNAIGDSDNFVQLIGWLFGLIEGTINLFASFTRLGNWFTENRETFQPILDVFSNLFDILGPLITEVGRLIENLATSEPIIIAVTALLQLLALPIEVLAIVLTEVIRVINEFIEAMGGAENRVSEHIDNLTGFFKRFGRDVANTWERATGAVGRGVSRVKRFFGDLGRGISDAWRNIRRSVSNGVDAVVNFVTGLPGRIARGVSGAFDSLWTNFRNAVNRIVDGWNGLSFSLGGGSYDPLGAFGPTISVPSFTISTPNIPRLQRGGLIERAGIAEVGEAGRETVFLPQGAQVDPRPIDRIISESTRLPDEFEATAIIDLGNDIQRAIQLTFRRVATNARAGQRVGAAA